MDQTAHMGSGHSHTGADELDHLVDAQVRRNLWVAVGAFAAVIVVGLIALWPTGSDDEQDPLGLGGEPVGASVESVTEVPCTFDPLLACKLVDDWDAPAFDPDFEVDSLESFEPEIVRVFSTPKMM